MYEVRYGFPASYARLLFVCAAFALGSVFVGLPAPIRAVELAVFGGGGLVLIVLGLRAIRLVALRVDESGLMLGGSLAKYGTTTRVVPWNELRSVRLAGKPIAVLTALRRGNRDDFSKPVQGWRLDVDQLTEALKAHGVTLLDNR